MDGDQWWDEAYDDYSQTKRGRAAQAMIPPKSPAAPPDSLPAPSPSRATLTSNASQSDPNLRAPETSMSEAHESDDDDGGWVEFHESEGKRKLWYNYVTKEVSHEDPKHKVDARLMSMSSATAFDHQQDQDMRQVHRNSTIHSMAWEAPASEDGKGAAAAAAAAGPAAQIDVVEDRLPHATATVNVALKTDPQTVINEAIVSISSQVSSLLERKDDMPGSMAMEIAKVRDIMSAVRQEMDKEAQSLDNRGDVEALIEFHKLTWKFDREEVKGYRARAMRVLHPTFKDWHAPHFESNFPLPPTNVPVTCQVRLPAATDQELKQTRINLQPTTTVQQAIEDAIKRSHSRGASSLSQRPSDYVLRACGYRDFMEEGKLYDYEYVRQCIRDGVPVELVLLPRPQPVAPSPEALAYQAEYKAKTDAEQKVLTSFEHQSVAVNVAAPETLEHFPVAELHATWRLRVLGAENVCEESLPRLEGNTPQTLFVRTFLFYGTETIGSTVRQTREDPYTSSPRWGWTMPVDPHNMRPVSYREMPRATKCAFLLFAKALDKEELLGYVVVSLFDHLGRLRTGKERLHLWALAQDHKEAKDADPEFIYRATTRDNQISSSNPAVIYVQFDDFPIAVVAPVEEPFDEKQPPVADKPIPNDVKRKIDTMVVDPLYRLKSEDKVLFWTHRHQLKGLAQALPKVVQSADWLNVEQRHEVYRLLKEWKSPDLPIQAIELLDVRFHDARVRQWAVNQLRNLKDDELQLFLLQLTQALKTEPYHDSPLTRFLVHRALQNPYQVGHFFFWHLKAELANPEFCERYGVILEEFLSFAGEFTKQLRKQNNTVRKLQRLAELIVKLKLEHKYTDQQCMKEYNSEIEKLNRDFFSKMGSFQVPLNPRVEATTLIPSKCRYMSSKKIPLWLVFNNADSEGTPIYIIFKAGDDLRQDILTLQLLKIMDKIWLQDNLDMRLKPYRCLATGVNERGEGVGMIEVVLNSDTTSGIQLKYGGGAFGALKMEPIDLFLRDHNKQPDMFKAAQENFVYSCAGYCVATYVMGIGDRHNGNIMVTKDGHLFHIDFGHFLGNFKKKFGFNRERAAFVFTPEMAYAMGGKNFKESANFKTFKDICCKAFNSLRKHASLLENLFILMVSAGMPELGNMEDIEYLKEKLLLSHSDSEAEKQFRKEIQKSLDNTWRRIDNAIHNVKHG